MRGCWGEGEKDKERKIRKESENEGKRTWLESHEKKTRQIETMLDGDHKTSKRWMGRNFERKKTWILKFCFF